jgi:NAD(P)-dependent dehydrogenase (short-subunit alcohol dehydrogenase family)
LKTLSEDPSNVIIGLVRNVETTQEKVSKDKLANVHVLHGDVTDPASLAAAAQQTSQIAGGVVDHLIVNAGYQSAESYMKTPPDFVGKEDLFLKELDNYMHANVAGALFTINAFLPLVKQSEVKKVVVITTGHADEHAMRVWGPGMANAVPYCLSKVALNYLSLLYAVTLKDEGVIFLALSPGCVLTMAERLEDGMYEWNHHTLVMEYPLTFAGDSSKRNPNDI